MTKSSDLGTVRLVIICLAAIAFVALLGEIFLIWKLVDDSYAIEPSAVAAIVPVGNLASVALGALGAVLVTTNSKSKHTEEDT